MKARNDCIACLFKQALNTVQVASDDPAIHEKVLRQVAAKLPDIDLNNTPAAVSQHVYDIINEVSGNQDPFKEQKEESNAEALRLLPRLEEMVRSSEDILVAAVRLAAAGNVIDLGIGAGNTFDIEKDVEAMMHRDFAIEDIDDLRRDLGRGGKLMYLGDNAGEIVLDRVLVQQILNMGMDVTFVVKSRPVINDATMEDAVTAGLTDIVKVIETGSGDIGIDWSRCSAEFLAAYDSADIVISKGQGNFETVSGREGNIYFLLKAKCECVADELGVDLGDIVLKHA